MCKTALISFASVAFLASTLTAAAPAVQHPLKLKILSSDWGNASVRDLQKVYHSASIQIWRHMDSYAVNPIQIGWGDDGPIVYYARAKNGDYQVRINSRDTYWSQHAFQFAHEFCHILCRYKEADKSNLWFEESLCEMASLFSLRSMAEEWKENPPYANWKSYSSSLHDYAQERIDRSGIPDGLTLAQWYQKHEGRLRNKPTDRDKNLIVAAAMLEKFERNPEHWGALTSINEGRSDEEQSFAEYLSAWQRNCPSRHRAFVAEIAAMFGVKL